jgi:CheY-like chemotaxis protein
MDVSSNRPATILLVEDNPDHAEMTLRALEDGRLINTVVWVKDGAEALDYLFRRGPHAEAVRPCLILLDVQLPKVSGHKVLQQIKDDVDLQRIPIVMLTTSERPDEIEAAYRAGVNSFVTKPVRFEDFVKKVQAVKLYWVLTNRLPDA